MDDTCENCIREFELLRQTRLNLEAQIEVSQLLVQKLRREEDQFRSRFDSRTQTA